MPRAALPIDTDGANDVVGGDAHWLSESIDEDDGPDTVTVSVAIAQLSVVAICVSSIGLLAVLCYRLRRWGRLSRPARGQLLLLNLPQSFEYQLVAQTAQTVTPPHLRFLTSSTAPIFVVNQDLVVVCWSVGMANLCRIETPLGASALSMPFMSTLERMQVRAVLQMILLDQEQSETTTTTAGAHHINLRLKTDNERGQIMLVMTASRVDTGGERHVVLSGREVEFQPENSNSEANQQRAAVATTATVAMTMPMTMATRQGSVISRSVTPRFVSSLVSKPCDDSNSSNDDCSESTYSRGSAHNGPGFRSVSWGSVSWDDNSRDDLSDLSDPVQIVPNVRLDIQPHSQNDSVQSSSSRSPQSLQASVLISPSRSPQPPLAQQHAVEREKQRRQTARDESYFFQSDPSENSSVTELSVMTDGSGSGSGGTVPWRAREKVPVLLTYNQSGARFEGSTGIRPRSTLAAPVDKRAAPFMLLQMRAGALCCGGGW